MLETYGDPVPTCYTVVPPNINPEPDF